MMTLCINWSSFITNEITIQKRYSKIYSSSGATTPDNIAFDVDGMV